MPAIPIIGGAVSIGKGIYDAYQGGKTAGTQRDLMRQQQAIMRQQSTLANEIGGFARQQHSMAEPALGKAMQYYMQLASGGRGGIQSAIAPDIARLNETYRGAERGLTSKLAPGPGRDRQIAELYRQRAGQMGILPFQARQAAMDKMEDAGRFRLGAASDAYGKAGNALSGASSSGSAASRTATDAYNTQQGVNSQWGQVIAGGTDMASRIWDWYRRRHGGGGMPDTYGTGVGF